MEDVFKVAGGVVIGLAIWAVIDLFAFSLLEARFAGPPSRGPGG